MKLLLIEDESLFAMDVIKYLNTEEFRCEWVATLDKALDKIVDFEYDCILLDLSLPDGDGLLLLEKLRSLGRLDSLIIISAKDTLEIRLQGLRLGADDFLMKPFHLAELSARIHAVVRRKRFASIDEIEFNEIKIDTVSKSVFVHSNLIELTRKELDLLMYLIGNKNRVLSKATLAEYLSGDMADMLDNHDFIYAHIKNLKKKLSLAGSEDYIKTIYGLGYKWQN